MTTQKRKVFEELQQRGWIIKPEEKLSWHWWADGVWIIHHPDAAHHLYLTFIVDPMCKEPRKVGEGVHAITASKDEPNQHGPTQLTLRRGWEKQLQYFLLELFDLSYN